MDNERFIPEQETEKTTIGLTDTEPIEVLRRVCDGTAGVSIQAFYMPNPMLFDDAFDEDKADVRVEFSTLGIVAMNKGPRDLAIYVQFPDEEEYREFCGQMEEADLMVPYSDDVVAGCILTLTELESDLDNVAFVSAYVEDRAESDATFTVRFRVPDDQWGTFLLEDPDDGEDNVREDGTVIVPERIGDVPDIFQETDGKENRASGSDIFDVFLGDDE